MFLKLSTVLCNIIIIINLIIKITDGSSMDIYKNARMGTRIVDTRYGRMQGLVLPLDNFKFLKPVEAFLAVPYATPPTRSNRWVIIFLFYTLKLLCFDARIHGAKLNCLHRNNHSQTIITGIIYYSNYKAKSNFHSPSALSDLRQWHKIEENTIMGCKEIWKIERKEK